MPTAILAVLFTARSRGSKPAKFSYLVSGVTPAETDALNRFDEATEKAETRVAMETPSSPSRKTRPPPAPPGQTRIRLLPRQLALRSRAVAEDLFDPLIEEPRDLKGE